MDELRRKISRVIALLEEQLEALRHEYGEDRYLTMIDPNGNFKATPILVALCNAYTALANIEGQSRES